MLASLIRSYLPATPRHVEAQVMRRLRDAAAYVPYYRELLAARGLRTSDFKCLSDYVDGFPRTTAREYRLLMEEHGDAFVMDRRYAGSPLMRLRTSGSAGIPTVILRTKSEFAQIHAANTLHTLLSAGVRPWHKIMYMLSPWNLRNEHHPLQRAGIFRRFDASFAEDPNTILKRITDNGVNVMVGRASILAAVAERCVDIGRKLPMQVILPGAEVIPAATRRLLRQIFEPRLYREVYGSTETGLIALRKNDDDYVVNFRSVLFALTRPNQEAGLTRGEIAVTSLGAAAAPLLMLELGDVLTCRNYDGLLSLKTSIVAIEGRVHDYVLGLNGEKISSNLFYGLLGGEPDVRQFRIVQEKVGECEIQVRGEFDASLVSRLNQHLHGSITFQLRYVDFIPQDASGKARIIARRIAR
jgi:phenylacetate-coenzyme A ligase PaaK-like adenylate-forming protein